MTSSEDNEQTGIWLVAAMCPTLLSTLHISFQPLIIYCSHLDIVPILVMMELRSNGW